MFDALYAVTQPNVSGQEIVVATQSTTMPGATGVVLANCTATESIDAHSADVDNLGGYSPMTVVTPALAVRRYIAQLSKFKNNDYDLSAAKTTILEMPKYGSLVFAAHDPSDGDGYIYRSKSGFTGKDKIVSLVEVDGKNFKIATTVLVVAKIQEDICFDVKRISKLGDTEGVPTAQQWLNVVGFSGALSFADIPGLSLASANGSKIIFDKNAAGHGWFFDWQGSRSSVGKVEGFVHADWALNL